jgi:glutamate/tyrosine decarboxylase-like PLP-dependent enzyme
MTHKGIDIKSLMLGPKGENHKEFSALIQEIIDDHIYWRRNFYPEDVALIKNTDKESEAFHDFQDALKDLLFQFLSESKKSVPFSSARYIGHMNTDLVIPGIIGYFAGILYNQNNVASESSPVSSQMEKDAVKLLLEMIGYDANVGDGYLSSGGTAANIHALWVARNMKLWPLAVAMAIKTNQGDDLFEALRKSDLIIEHVLEKKAQDLLNLSPGDVIQLKEEIYNELRNLYPENPKEKIGVFENFILEFTVNKKGIHHFFKMARKEFPDEKEEEYLSGEMKVFLTKNKHYSLPKALDLLGIGQHAMEEIPCNNRFQVDIDALQKRIAKLKKEKKLVLAMVSIFGSTEQGSLDDLSQIEKICKSNGYWWHVDAAYGGYLFSICRNGKNPCDVEQLEKWTRDTIVGVDDALPAKTEEQNQIIKQINFENIIKYGEAVKASHSITIDPHKMGYIPYSAGSILYRDRSYFEFVSYDAPYLWKGKDSEDDFFIGRYTLEGSRPGAVAAAINLSSKLIPLNQEGHGKLIILTFIGAIKLLNSLKKASGNDIGVKFLVDTPETNVLNYIPYTRLISTSRELKILTERLIKRLKPTNEIRPYMVVDTNVKVGTLKGIFEDIGITNDLEDDVDFPVIRSVVMSPLAFAARTKKDHHIFDEYAAYLMNIIGEETRDMYFERLFKKVSVLIVDDVEDSYKDVTALRSINERNMVNIEWVATKEEAIKQITQNNFDIAILDIDLAGDRMDQSGIEICEKILEDDNCHGIRKILFYSSFIDQNREQLNHCFEMAKDKEISIASIERERIATQLQLKIVDYVKGILEKMEKKEKM